MDNSNKYPMLSDIQNASDLRKVAKENLQEVCDDVRQFIIDTVSKTSGHLASGLGVVELSVALHYVYDTPKDKIIWDVGHQAYPHKILTGNKDRLSTIRKKDGLHSFIWRNETAYDVLCTGHASTSIGSALGLAQANKLKGSKDKVVAVIGDGALSGGSSFEALNNAGSLKDIDLLVILNDNEMSISENVGALSQLLSKILAHPHYVKFVEGGKKVLESFPAVKNFALKAQEHAKGMVMPGTLFEEFGFNYIGPIDGHDINRLVSILKNIKEIGGLQFLHIVTTKGKGYKPAELDPICYHGVPIFNPQEGIHPSPHPTDNSYSKVFGTWLCDMAKSDDKLVAITPAMRIGSAMDDFAKAYPDRFFDVAIAEQHALVFASGLAAGGLKPIVAIYSSFLQRAYDGVIHDIAIQNLPIVLAIDRAGIVGPDGPTHQGAFDIAYLQTIPNMTIMAPSSRKELYMMLNTAYKLNAPVAVRYPRDNGDDEYANTQVSETLAIGEGRVLFEGKKVCLLVFGTLLNTVEKMAREHNFALVDMRFIKPFDKKLIARLKDKYEYFITIEEGAKLGGIGQSISSYLHEIKADNKILNIALPDEFIFEGTRAQMLEYVGLSADKIFKTILDFVE